MKTNPTPPRSTRRRGHSGFTLIELMVAMAITTIIVTILVSVTSIALDAWNRSRSELRAARQAKAMVDAMARDLESLVTRRGNAFEWLYAKASSSMPGERLKSSNASDLIFFTAATDRYNGKINTNEDKGGDVSCVGYRLDYKDPIDTAGGGNYKTFVLNRLLVNPDETFTNLLGRDNLATAFSNYSTRLNSEENFVCENVFQFSVTFHVEVSKNVGSATQPRMQVFVVPISLGSTNSGQTVDEFRIRGTGIFSPGLGAANIGSTSISADEIKGGRIAAVELSLTVLTDVGIDQQRNRVFSGSEGDFLKKHSYQYTKRIDVPSM